MDRCPVALTFYHIRKSVLNRFLLICDKVHPECIAAVSSHGELPSKLEVLTVRPITISSLCRAEPGFMKGFEGVWAVKPVELSRDSGATSASYPDGVVPSFASLSATRRVMPSLSLARLPGTSAKRKEKLPRKVSDAPPQLGSEMILHQRIVPFFLPPGPIGMWRRR